MSGRLLTIRSFRGEDFEALLQIDQTCFPEDIAFSRGEMTFYLNHPKSIARVAEGAGKIIGFVLAQIESGARAHVLTLDVISDARRRKTGTALMNALHKEIGELGIGMTVLEVGAHNLAAQRLYEKLRYQYLETLNGYYRGKEDAYRMVRVVAGSL